MPILYALSEIRTPFWDTVMGLVTQLGEQTILLAVGMVMLWSVDKKWGMRLFWLGLIGAVLNLLLKSIFVVPRPWVLDPNFQIVASAQAAATGYSFPSGHTQSAALLLGGVALWKNKPWIWGLAIFGTLVVGFSRLYLGVHTPADVVVSLVLGAGLIAGAGVLFKRAEEKPHSMNALLLGGVVFACVVVLYTLFAPAGANNVAEFDAHGRENAYTALGAMLGLWCIQRADEKKIHFPTNAVWWAQAGKCVLGIGMVMLVRIVLKAPLHALFYGNEAAYGARYFLMAVTGGVLWPLTFRFFSKLGKQ